ncbi:MAG: NUDIX domain-containing protein [Planctomycetia bacterium]|nr:NUDIX domain-containing protein [Planctomycetia bacterium]
MSERRDKILRLILIILTWVYFFYMAYMLLTPHPGTPKAFTPLSSVLHLGAFGTLGLLTELSRRVWRVQRWYLLLLVWSVLSEVLQIFTGRCFEWGDIVQNIVGTSLGCGVAIWIKRALARFLTRSVSHVGEGAVAILVRPPMRLSDLATVDWSTVETLAIRRSEYVVAPGALCFPGGGVEPHETLEEAVCREFMEEVGIAINVSALITTSFTPSGRTLNWFFAETCEPNPEIVPTIQPQEVASYQWTPLPELIADPSFLANNRAIVEQILSGALRCDVQTSGE